MKVGGPVLVAIAGMQSVRVPLLLRLAGMWETGVGVEGVGRASTLGEFFKPFNGLGENTPGIPDADGVWGDKWDKDGGGCG